MLRSGSIGLLPTSQCSFDSSSSAMPNARLLQRRARPVSGVIYGGRPIDQDALLSDPAVRGRRSTPICPAAEAGAALGIQGERHLPCLGPLAAGCEQFARGKGSEENPRRQEALSVAAGTVIEDIEAHRCRRLSPPLRGLWF